MFNFWTLFKKEVYRVFSDKRLVVMIFILPGLSIFIMYTLIGSIIERQIDQISEHEIIMYQVHMPEALNDYFELLEINMQVNDFEALEGDYEVKIREGDIDIVLIFDEDFEERIADAEISIPNVSVYYNSGRQQSAMANNRITQALSAYRETILRDRLDNPDAYFVFSTDTGIFVDEDKVAGQSIAALMPMLIVIFLFAGAMSIGPDSIAGEKERGTIATLLITPIGRGELAFGKITSLAVLALASALSSFVGIALSLPRLMQMDGQGTELLIYGLKDYLAILFILMATVLVIVGLIATLSAYAKTIKEASMFIMPFYFITLIIGIVTSFGQDPMQSIWVHMIPLFGAVNLLTAVFTFQWSLVNLFAVIISSVVYTLIFAYILKRLFNNEKVMFQK